MICVYTILRYSVVIYVHRCVLCTGIVFLCVHDWTCGVLYDCVRVVSR